MTPSLTPDPPRSRLGGAIALLIWLGVVGGWVFFMAANTPEPALSSERRPHLPTPTPTIVRLSVVESVASDRYAQLQAMALPATPTPTATVEPSATPVPVTPTPTAVQSVGTPATATPTIAAPSPTPPLPPTPAGVAATPNLPATLEAASGPCDCEQDTYDCDDFFTVYIRDDVAQACHTRCLFLTGLDVHQLDPDGDGLACTYIP